MNKEDLRKTLEELGWTEVDEESGRFTAVVVSSLFEGMDEGERQHRVWKHVLDRLGSPASVDVEFIYTYSPSEKAKLDRGEALPELND